MPRSDGALASFSRRFLDAGDVLTRIGDGRIGGKGTGLAKIHGEIIPRVDRSDLPGLSVAVPRLTVLATDVFDEFMASNDLYEVALSGAPDDRIAHAFQKARFPARHVGDLRALVTGLKTPMAVRSSSLLEDDLAHPFAGVYETKMIPNNQPEIDVRFARLIEAVKFVYASTFMERAQSYIASVSRDPSEEKMAVILQDVVGKKYGDRFYPAVSGVGRSFNYYPTGHGTPGDGVVSLALGLGKEIVDGGAAWTYSPAFPEAPPPVKDVGALLKSTQTEFWAIHVGRPPLPDPIRETEYLVRPGLSEAEWDGTLRLVASTYDPDSDRLRPGLGKKGPRVVNFSPILEFGEPPLNELVSRLLAASKEVEGMDVEIEFAVNIDDVKGKAAGGLGFLQVRPMMVSTDEVALAPEDLEGPGVVLASESVLGNGRLEPLRDVVFVKPDVFEAKWTGPIAAELGGMNRALAAEGRPYLLIGFGRWGSSDPWLGIPVDWGAISGARAIVEATLPEMSPDLSQGSHFFHNLLSFKVLYFSVPHGSLHPIRWDWLEQQETVRETRFVKWIRSGSPLEVAVDARRRRGVVRRHAA